MPGPDQSEPFGANSGAGFQAQFNSFLQVLTRIATALTPVVVQSSQVEGTDTNDNAPTGFIEEYLSQQVLSGAAVALTTTVPANIATLSLTPGDWDVWGNVLSIVAGGTTTQNLIAWISDVSATGPTPPNNGAYLLDERPSAAGTANGGPVGIRRFSIAVPTTVYLSMRLDFSVSTAAGYGFIAARRRR